MKKDFIDLKAGQRITFILNGITLEYEVTLGCSHLHLVKGSHSIPWGNQQIFKLLNLDTTDLALKALAEMEREYKIDSWGYFGGAWPTIGATAPLDEAERYSYRAKIIFHNYIISYIHEAMKPTPVTIDDIKKHLRL